MLRQQIFVNRFRAQLLFRSRRLARQIWHWFTIVAVISALSGWAGTRVGYTDDGNEDPETTEVVVKLDVASGATIDAVNHEYGTTTLEELLGSAGIYRLRVPAGQEAKEVAKDLKKDGLVLYAEPNFVGETPQGEGRFTSEWGGQDPTSQHTQYATAILGLPAAHALRRGANTIVAVLDTGIQLNHPAFATALTVARYDFIDDDDSPVDVGNGQDDDNDGRTDEAQGHGTHVAGIVHQVAPDAKIMPLRVLDADGRGNIFVIAEAILYAAEHGADVINLSLGSSAESELMKDIIEDVIEEHDVVVVAAAGNLNSIAEQFPASEDDVLAVTAIGPTSVKSDFANYGEWIDVVAPGEGILSAFPTDGYAWWSGTSMATPYVAGQAALIRSAVPAITAPYIMAHIRASAQSVAAANPEFEEKLGAGRIDIGGSLQAMCAMATSCQMPDLTGLIVLEAEAKIDSRPLEQLTGTWVIGGVTYMADGETEFDAEEASLQVGNCAKIEYRNTDPFMALQIRVRDAGKCNASPTATPTPTGIFGATPMATATPTSSTTGTPPPNVTPTVTVTATPTTMPSTTPTPPINGEHTERTYLPFVTK